MLLSGWNASAVVELVSGSPLNAVLSSGVSNTQPRALRRPAAANLIRRSEHVGQRRRSRVASEGNDAATYFNAAAFTNPGAGQYGTAPRADGDARYQFRKNIDLVISKDTTIAPHAHRGRSGSRSSTSRTRRSSEGSTRTPSTRRASAASRNRPGSCASGSCRSAIGSEPDRCTFYRRARRDRRE